MKKLLFLTALLTIACQPPHKEVKFTENDINIIPQPKKLALLNKDNFWFNKQTAIVSDIAFVEAAELFAKQFKKASGFELSMQASGVTTNYIALVVDKSLPKEGYTLVVEPERISITAANYNGALYALETLRQLLPKEFESSTPVQTDWVVPAIVITDAPQYPWRGLMLDVSRHFFS